MNYHNKTFRSVTNTPNGTVSGDTIFHYRQTGSIVTAEYTGGSIVFGQLLASMDESGNLDMRYHHITDQGLIQTGTCQSAPELLPDGRIRLHESWKWTSGDASSGHSIIEEFPD